MAGPPKLVSRKRWSTATESSSLQPRHRLLEEASRHFDVVLTAAEQLRAASEIVTTRSSELTLAYTNVVMVTAGRKKMRGRKPGTQRLTNTPCVVLAVREKWTRTKDKGAGHQLIPKRLLTYATHDGRRLLCAVPTDVQDEADTYGLWPQSARAVVVSDPDLEPELGVVACTVELQTSTGPLKFVMGARHVFSPIPEIGGRKVKGSVPFAPMRDPDSPPGAPILGMTTTFGGVLTTSDDISFDVQLASVASGSWSTVKTMLDGMRLSKTEPFIPSRDRFEEICLDNFFEILVPDNHPDAGMKPRKTLSTTWETTLEEDFSFSYPVRLEGKRTTCLVSHWELLKLSIANGRRTLPGDSGSPVVWWRDDGACTLVGMHIAGKDGASVSLAIPSWQLFSVDNYLSLPNAVGMKPINI